MLQGVVVLAEGVFIGAKVIESLLQKPLQPGVGAGLVVGNPERPQLAGVIGEVAADQFPHRRLVVTGGHHRQRWLLVMLRQTAAVVGIETPAAARGGTVGLQQQPQPAALALVEALHQRAPPPLKPNPALSHRFQEGGGGQHGEPQLLLLAEVLEPLLKTPVGNFGHPQLLAHTRLACPQLRCQLRRKPLPERHALGSRQLEITHINTPLQQRVAEAAHRHEGMQQAQLVIAIGGGHRQVFDHQHPATAVELQRRRAEPLAMQLIAKDQG